MSFEGPSSTTTTPPLLLEDTGEVLPLPAIICIAIGAYLVVIVLILFIRSLLLQKGLCQDSCNCCGKEGQPHCCECWIAFADSCNCCKNPTVDACLNSCCPKRRKLDCAEIVMCQCCAAGGCCGMCASEQPLCDNLKTLCYMTWCCVCQPIISLMYFNEILCEQQCECLKKLSPNHHSSHKPDFEVPEIVITQASVSVISNSDHSIKKKPFILPSDDKQLIEFFNHEDFAEEILDGLTGKAEPSHMDDEKTHTERHLKSDLVGRYMNRSMHWMNKHNDIGAVKKAMLHYAEHAHIHDTWDGADLGHDIVEHHPDTHQVNTGEPYRSDTTVKERTQQRKLLSVHENGAEVKTRIHHSGHKTQPITDSEQDLKFKNDIELKKKKRKKKSKSYVTAKVRADLSELNDISGVSVLPEIDSRHKDLGPITSDDISKQYTGYIGKFTGKALPGKDMYIPDDNLHDESFVKNTRNDTKKPNKVYLKPLSSTLRDSNITEQPELMLNSFFDYPSTIASARETTANTNETLNIDSSQPQVEKQNQRQELQSGNTEQKHHSVRKFKVPASYTDSVELVRKTIPKKAIPQSSEVFEVWTDDESPRNEDQISPKDSINMKCHGNQSSSKEFQPVRKKKKSRKYRKPKIFAEDQL